METPALGQIIRHNIQNPVQIIESLQRHPSVLLRDYTETGHNNLFHITIEALLSRKGLPNYPQLIESCKPLLTYLDNLGVSINEMNDDHNTPLFLVYYDRNQNNALEQFLEFELHGNPTQFSIKPEIRALKRIIFQTCCGCFMRKSKQS